MNNKIKITTGLSMLIGLFLSNDLIADGENFFEDLGPYQQLTIEPHIINDFKFYSCFFAKAK